MQDSLLLELYQTPRDTQTLDLVARNAPILYFDAREPFLPLAAGYTLFTGDGPSPSFDRIVELRPEDRPAAALAIEYAIWWDWDIHHLYELEHAWVYLDSKGFPVRLEASWHGKYYDLPLNLEGGRAVLLSEAGKHAFAPDPSWFRERALGFRRVETQAVGVHAQVLVNSLVFREDPPEGLRPHPGAQLPDQPGIYALLDFFKTVYLPSRSTGALEGPAGLDPTKGQCLAGAS